MKKAKKRFESQGRWRRRIFSDFENLKIQGEMVISEGGGGVVTVTKS